MNEHQIWKHANGDFFAVTIDGTGFLLAACGPITTREFTECLKGNFDGDFDLTRDLRENDEMYGVYRRND